MKKIKLIVSALVFGLVCIGVGMEIRNYFGNDEMIQTEYVPQTVAPASDAPTVELSDVSIIKGKSYGKNALLINFRMLASNMGGGTIELRTYLYDDDGHAISLKNGNQYVSFSTGIPENCAVAELDGEDFKSVILTEDLDISANTTSVSVVVKAFTSGGEFLASSSGDYMRPAVQEAYTHQDNLASAPQPDDASASCHQKESEPGLIHQGQYYLTGLMDSGNGWQKVMGATSSFPVKIYEDRIDYDGLKYYRKGTENYRGVSCDRYLAVDNSGNLMHNKYLLRNDKTLTDVLVVDIMGYKSRTYTQIAQGRSNGESYSPPSSGVSVPVSDGPSQSAQRQRMKCTFCNGTGYSPIKEYSTQYYGKGTLVKCDICNEVDYDHYHKKCPSCTDGYVYR